MLSIVSQENVVTLYGYSRDSPNMCLIMEYVQGGSLSHFLHCKKIAYTVAQSISWMRQCAEGIAYLHSMQPKPMIHRDLKPANLLVKNGCIKICDFGLARLAQTLTMSSNIGTIEYMAPGKM